MLSVLTFQEKQEIMRDWDPTQGSDIEKIFSFLLAIALMSLFVWYCYKSEDQKKG